MYTNFFGFKERPFQLVPNPEYLFLSRSHEEAIAHLNYTISHGDGFVEITGEVGIVSCRFTHVYPDGPAPYFTFFAVGDGTGDLRNALEKWRRIKRAANDLVVSFGGTVTHHHAVGRDHRSGYEQQSPELYRRTLAAAKATVDPEGIFNPGVLIDPVGKTVGITGVLGEEQ